MIRMPAPQQQQLLLQQQAPQHEPVLQPAGALELVAEV